MGAGNHVRGVYACDLKRGWCVTTERPGVVETSLCDDDVGDAF